ARPGTDVLHLHCAPYGAVRPPQLAAGHAVVGREIQSVVQHGECRRRRTARDVDTFNLNCAGGDVVYQQPEEGRAVEGREIQLVVEHREAGRKGIAREVDVLHLHRAQCRAVALPQLDAAHAVVGREIQSVVEHGESRWRGTPRHLDTSNGNCAGGDVLYQ